MEKPKILLVEDAPIAQKMGKFILLGLGCQVDVVETGYKALEMFEKTQYDLIFMDIGLPDIDGVNVTKEIRRLENNDVHVPIVALTANNDSSYKDACLREGMNDFILKPLTKENAQMAIDKFLKIES